MKRALLFALLLVGCGSSTSTQSTPPASGSPATTSQSPQAPATAPTQPKPIFDCIRGRVAGQPYGGIGASVSAFKSQNTVGQPPSYQPGLAYYTIDRIVKGCVSEYEITESTVPTQSIRDLLSLVAGIGLPPDANQLVNQDRCEVWSSVTLKHATGNPYAVGYVTIPPEGTATGTVDMAASDSPHC